MSQRKQKGALSSDLGMWIGGISLILIISIPVFSNVKENMDAAEITVKYNTLREAQSDHYKVEGSYASDIANLASYLPQGFSKTAANGLDFSTGPNTDPTKMNIILNMPSDRIRSKVKAKLDSSTYSESGTTITMVAR
ncbi:hypothetical protein TUMSATVNIG1_60200 (plasmid) [Vibrio nigripulchritudo]|uniref:hypothetical protein n=1 Tax=Vibrio nigripulchritudo TaxID=28173 RepID=UPI001909C3D4|nr:hypothetical protein [Vibrio nigripulchritudo]BCL74034.1 hypothetical protein VNTUMSATTG_59710 [Vibrio nigripulchritudo]BDU35411.1 hypothetical protein TUMSATVNIG1_60200 [Vibrio nigripulchritudo]